MRCPYCNFLESKVTDSRVASDSIKRRRECLRCSQRFTTFETVDLTISVKKRNGTFEEFKKEKLLKGLAAACYHSSVSHDQVQTLANQITADIMQSNQREIDAQEIGEIVMRYLLKKDVIAYIRFACVYRRFKDIGELMETINAITPKDIVKKNNEEVLCP